VITGALDKAIERPTTDLVREDGEIDSLIQEVEAEIATETAERLNALDRSTAHVPQSEVAIESPSSARDQQPENTSDT